MTTEFEAEVAEDKAALAADDYDDNPEADDGDAAGEHD